MAGDDRDDFGVGALGSHTTLCRLQVPKEAMGGSGGHIELLRRMKILGQRQLTVSEALRRGHGACARLWGQKDNSASIVILT